MIEQQVMQREELHQHLEDGMQVVTANIRLSRALQTEFEHRAIMRGLQAWATPEILQWSVWLNNAWQDAVLSGELSAQESLLSTEQVQYIWASIIAASSVPVLRVEATARQVSAAWQLLQDWQCGRKWEDYLGNIDTREFYHWSDEFEARCLEQKWLTEAVLAQKLTDLFEQGSAALPGKIILAGFDELTPAQAKLCEALQHSDCQVHWVELAGEDSTAVQLECVDQKKEVATFSHWARQKLENNPEARVALVAPDLSAVRSLVTRTLDEVLDPSSQQPGVCLKHRPWNISLGLSLSQYSMIGTAIDVLDLARTESTMEIIGNLLRSPYLSGAVEETGARALLDRKLREMGEPIVTLRSLRYRAEEKDKPWCSPKLANGLAALEGVIKNFPARASAVQWVKVITRLLNAVGWGLDRGLTSDEYQAIEAWRKVLASFSGLDLVSGEASFTQALAILRRLTAEKVFQPRTGAASVQVLGLYEAIGQQFDALWVMGLHDGAWPASPRPNPFIPLSLQRRLGMPHADQTQELANASLITQRLQKMAAEVVMSFPAKQGEEHLRVSPLISDLPRIDKNALELWQGPGWREIVQQSGQLCVLVNDIAPPCEQTLVSGGSGIFRTQSLCPFRAFAEYRLGGRPLQTLQIGLDPMQRGSLLHRVLELFWRDVKDQQTLNAMSDDQLNDRLASFIKTAVSEMADSNPKTFTRRFTRIESLRLQSLAFEWLVNEKGRAPFTVQSLEQKREADINGIRVHLMIDRVDELADGRRLVIDYKTGKVSPAQWFGERPEEPQLPLYSAVEGENVCAVLFGQIRADGTGFNGVVEEDGLIPGLPGRSRQLKEAMEQWPAVLQEWDATVKRLAADFKAGRAEVDPKKPATCTSSFCELSALCRIDEWDELV